MSGVRVAHAAVVLAVAATGCVGTGRYQGALRERDEAREETQRLAASVEALTAERDALVSQLEDVRLEREAAAQAADARRGDCEAQLAAATRRLDELHATYEGLVRDLEARVATSNSQIERLREGLRISLPGEVLFESGAAELTSEGERVLDELARDLGRDAYAAQQILVEGHTDGAAVRGALAERFPSNWELAGARAARVVRALEAAGIDGTRLAAVSHGDRAPVATNDTPEGRAANRRIEIRLIPLPGAAPGETVPPPEAPAPEGPGGAGTGPAP